MPITINPQDEGLNKIKPDGQQESYLVLSEEERAKGFVRPVRQSYRHVGRKYKKEDVAIFKAPEKSSNGKMHVAKYIALKDKNGKAIGWGFFTAEELKQFQENDGYVGGCGTVTKMGIDIAETYARNPNFYGATYCVGCKTHHPVREFEWLDGELLGS